MNCQKCQDNNTARIRYGNYWLCDSCYNKSEQLWNESQQPAAIRLRLENQRIVSELYTWLGKLTMDNDKVELHAKFFNHEQILIKDMDIPTLRNHRKELELIAFEARARISADDVKMREHEAKLNPKQKEWLVSAEGPDITVSEAISNVAGRKKRMSAADKMAESLKSLGISGTGLNELMSKVEMGGTTREVTDKRPPAMTFNKSSQTREGLLADASKSMIEGISSERPIQDVVNVAKTAAHIGNRILKESEIKPDEQQPKNDDFDPSSLGF